MNPESESINTGVSAANSEQPVRIKLVNTAAEFLVSPSVQNSSMDMKVSFLKKKGLTDAEIDMAVKQSDARLMATRENGGGSGSSGVGGLPLSQMQMSPVYFPPPVSRWTMVRDVANTAILIAGFVYGVRWAYMNWIVPYFFGKKDRRSVESRLNELDTVSSCLTDMSSNVGKMREEMDRSLERRTEALHREISELKAEVTSLKKLLLNRKQFPAANTPLSIPSWQITENEEKQQATPEEEGNGSNGSESSLEMIKE